MFTFSVTYDVVFKRKEISKYKRGQWDSIKGKSGCYLFMNGNEAIYVGMSKDLRGRVRKYLKKGGANE
jgi:excinuclease UvrABC nuclease subunit